MCDALQLKTPRNRGGLGHLNIPIIADTTKDIAARYGVLIEDLGIALRGLFIINPEGVIEQITINSLPIGRNVDEALRLVQAIQFVAEHGEVCPANWQPGGKTMVAHHTESLDYFGSVAEVLPNLPPLSSQTPVSCPSSIATDGTAPQHLMRAFVSQDASYLCIYVSHRQGPFTYILVSQDVADEVDFGQSLRALKTPEEFTQAISATDRPVVVDFFAPWCARRLYRTNRWFFPVLYILLTDLVYFHRMLVA